MTRFALFILSLIIGSKAHTQSVTLNFDSLPSLVAEKNNHAKGAELVAQAAEKQTGHLVRSYLPTVELKAGAEQFTTGQEGSRTEPFGGIEAKINLFRSGNDLLENKIRKEELKLAQAQASATYREELKKVRKAYWTLVFQRELISLLEQSIKENDRNLVSANKRIRAGIATESDRIEFEMSRVELEQDISRLKLSNENIQRELATLLGYPSQTKFDSLLTVTHEHDDEVFKAVLKTEDHPQLIPSRTQASIASLKKSQARRAWLPRLDLFGTHFLYTFREREYEDQANRWDTAVGVQLTMSLFDGGASRSQAAALALESSGFQREALQTRNELETRFEGARAELKLTHDLVHDSETTIKKSERYISRTLDEYKRGVKNSLDVLNASSRYFEIRRRFAELRRDYQLARADLMELVGK